VGETLPDADITEADLTPIVIEESTKYDSIAIGADGSITAIDETGASVTLGQIALATFVNSDGLIQRGSMYMSPSSNSGEPVFYAPGSSSSAGSIVTNGLEMSNVDLGKQFTDMIIAQRGFQANSRVITTSDEILQELVSLKR
jgi:flagellar hook protein FlgE